VPEAVGLTPALARTIPVLLQRLRSSYRPKFVAILSDAMGELVPALQSAGWAERLILDDGRPFQFGSARLETELHQRILGLLPKSN